MLPANIKLFRAFSELNYCDNNPGICQNGAKCISLIKEDGNYKCLCREGTYGRNCENSEFNITIKPSTETATAATLINVTLLPEEKPEELNATTNLAENEAV